VAESAARPPPPRERDLSGVQIAGIVVAGTGLAALIVAAATGAAAGSRYSTLEDICGPEPCTDPSFADVIDSGKTYEKVAYISLAVGGAALLGGGAMILFGGQDEQVTATPLPEGAMLGYRRRF
jgi:hypothetical protein